MRGLAGAWDGSSGQKRDEVSVVGNIVTVGLPVVGTIISALVVFLPEYSGTSFSLAEQLSMCGGTFVAIASMEVLWIVRRILDLRTREYRTWVVRDRVDGLLRDIQNAFTKVHAVRYGEEDLFVTHFDRALSDMARNVERAADHMELQVWNHHFGSVRRVMNVFAGDAHPTYWYTWWLGAEDRLFGDSHWRSYFSQIVGMVKKGHVKEVRTLLIVDGLDQLDGERVAALVGFCRANKVMECGVVLAAEYSRFRRDAELPGCDLDFGIFGTRLLFRTESEEETSGVFCKHPQVITRYREHFEAVWEHPDTRRQLPGGEGVVTLEDLLAADAVRS